MWERFSVEHSMLPLAQSVAPAQQEQAAEYVRACAASATPVYPIGGGTALEYGVLPTRPGMGLELRNLKRVVDFPHRDTTITVEAGLTLAELDATIAPYNLRLPIDAPQPEKATLGGVLATQSSGPLRYKWGTLRDYVIGITAIDGTGALFHGGGRVVKNVAGYDLCRLMAGSLGVLGLITQVSLKLIPRPEAFRWVAVDAASHAEAEAVLAAVTLTKAVPVAVELLYGPAWNDDAALGPASPQRPWRIVVGLEGSPVELDWMTDRLKSEWQPVCSAPLRTIQGEAATGLHQRLRDFSAVRAPLVVKLVLPPNLVTRWTQQLLDLDPKLSIQSHAGDGVVWLRFSQMESLAVRLMLEDQLRKPLAGFGGYAVMISHQLEIQPSSDLWWGPLRPDGKRMEAVRNKLDPKGIMNPGRIAFV